MKPSNELFDLIKSLTKSEKRFFKLQSSLQSGDKNYVRLFDLIDKMEEYDEELVKKTFKGEKFIKHLPSEKNHLYKLILKALRSYYGETSISSTLKQEIKNIEILYNKALFDECSKFLERAKKMAAKYEKFYYLFELIYWEKTLLEESFEDGKFIDLNKLIEEERDVLEKLSNLAAYHVLYSKINYVFRSGGYSRTEENIRIVEEIVNDPLIKGKNTALSKRAATICYYTQGFCNLAKGDSQTALEKFMRVRTILDESPSLKSDLAKRYIRTLSNIIICLTDLKRFDEAREFIQQMRSLTGQDGFDSPDIRTAIFKDTGLSQLSLYHFTGQFTKAMPDLEEITKNLAEYEGKLHKEHELAFFYQFAYIQFGAGNYSKALSWLNKVLNDNETDLRQDLYSYARLFNLVIHYELGNYDLLEYTIKSTVRYLQKRMRDFPVEKLIIEQFKKLIRTQSATDKRNILQNFREQLKQEMRRPEDEVVLRYFDFHAWIESKLSGENFEQLVQRSVSKKQLA
jgi:tetratricopeptide (TPR) repeat protein